MAQCEVLVRCPFFAGTMSEMLTASDVLKQRYCQGDNSRCARYMVLQALGSSKVPRNLYPTQVDIAEELIRLNR